MAGATEEEAFGNEEERAPSVPADAVTEPQRPRPEAKRPIRRPGLAGGTAELRGSTPDKPSL